MSYFPYRSIKEYLDAGSISTLNLVWEIVDDDDEAPLEWAGVCLEDLEFLSVKFFWVLNSFDCPFRVRHMELRCCLDFSAPRVQSPVEAPGPTSSCSVHPTQSSLPTPVPGPLHKRGGGAAIFCRSTATRGCLKTEHLPPSRKAATAPPTEPLLQLPPWCKVAF